MNFANLVAAALRGAFGLKGRGIAAFAMYLLTRGIWNLLI
jgi:hypothetical protein